MFTIEDVLSEENQQATLAEFRTRRDSSGPDGMRLSDLDDWFKANGAALIDSIRLETYQPGIAKCFEVATHSGKRREVVSINVVDRLVEKLVENMLCRHLNPLFSPNSFAYQEGKSTLDAAMLARSYIEDGYEFVCEIDLKDYFTTIDLSHLQRLVAEHVPDEKVNRLLELLLYRDVYKDNKLRRQERGLLQGASTSPVLSNLYLNRFDQHMDDLGTCWLRFSDNVFVYARTVSSASAIYSEIVDLLEWEHGVLVNDHKSGIHRAIERRILGYDLVESNGTIEVRRHTYTLVRRHDRWHASSVYKDHNAYHILQDGIITRKDYSVLFENNDERLHIPVEVTTQINIYSDVTVAPSALAALSEHNIRIAYVDRYGDLLGTFVPATHAKAAEVFLKQCMLYTSQRKRLEVARSLEKSSIHNMRANLRYYAKRGREGMDEYVDQLGSYMDGLQASESVDALRLIEARARKLYYHAFADILDGTDFDFTKRTRRPPKDPGNAMVSFGNTVLYNVVLQAIWRTSLDPKIGVVHATNRRNYSLNLDIADVFKPIIVDRVVFSLVNRHEVNVEEHFEACGEDGVILSREGKRVFLNAMERKLDDVIAYRGLRLSYRQLISAEVSRFQRMIVTGERYRPFKYY